MTNDVKVPTGLGGVITKLQGVSFCMDNATHLIHTETGAIRLSGVNEVVTKALNEASDGATKVFVMGYPTWGAECMFVSVYHVAHVSEVIKSLGSDDTWPWPWISSA